MATKTLDAKGRVTLGSQFAGQIVEIDDSDPRCILIKPVVMIPAEEAWLYRNKTATGLVRDGLAEARLGEFAEAPDVARDLQWQDDVEEVEE
jgi:hypothetical protein